MLGTADVSLTTPPNTSIYTAGGLFVTKQANVQGLVTATGGFINSTMYYLHAYNTSSQTVSARTTTAMACNLGAITISSTMSNVLTASSSSANTFTANVTGLWSIKASLRMTPATNGTIELYAQANSSNTNFSSPNNRYMHEQKYMPTNIQTKVEISNIVPLNQGDTVQFFMYFTPASGSLSNNLTLNTANDNMLSFTLVQRAA